MSLPFKKPDDIGGAIYGSQIGVYIFLVNDELFRTPRILKSLAVEVLGDVFFAHPMERRNWHQLFFFLATPLRLPKAWEASRYLGATNVTT